MAAALGDTSGLPGDASLAEVIRLAACGVPGVVGLSGATAASGSPGDWKGELAAGVQYRRAETGLSVGVHLIALPVPLLPLAVAVRMAVATALAQVGSPVVAVDVWVDEMETAAPTGEMS